MKTYVDVLDFLRSKHLAVIATVTKEGSPQCATVFFHLSDIESETRFHLYFITRRHTRKYSNLLAEKDPKVSLVIGTELEPYSLQFDGTAQFIESADGIGGLVEFREKLLNDPQLSRMYFGTSSLKDPFPRIEGTDFAVFRVNPTWVRYMHPGADMRQVEFVQLVP